MSVLVLVIVTSAVYSPIVSHRFADWDGQMDPEYMPSLIEPLFPDVELPCRSEHASRISLRFSPICGF